MNDFSIEKNKYIFFPGLLITILGNVIFSFATGLFLLEITGESSFFAINIIFATLPLAIAAPFLGKIIDLLPKKKIIIVGDFFNAILMLFIFILWNKVNNIYLIYFGSFLSSFLSFFVFLAYDAGKPQLFPKEWLMKANSFSSIIDSSCRVLGPLMGGIVYAIVDIRYFILLNSISFFISMLLECFLSFSEKKEKKKKHTKKWEGYYFIKNSKYLKKIILMGIMFNIGYGFSILIPIPYLVNNVFNLSKESYGVIQGFSPFGIIIGAIIINRFNKKLEIKFFIKLFYFLTGVSLIFLIPIIFNLSDIVIVIIYSLGMFLLGITISFIDIPLFTFLQNNSPENLRGEIIGLFISFIKVTLPFTLFLSGKIVDQFSPDISIILGILIYFLTGSFLGYSYNNKAILKSIKK
ncbi:MFS transporter [Psychrilyobacter sp.]|uniref:MFS transporter n=1 Tax=Psychrilyobacter sp. TaxID=2586924 RepID=UPI00301A9368